MSKHHGAAQAGASTAWYASRRPGGGGRLLASFVFSQTFFNKAKFGWGQILPC